MTEVVFAPLPPAARRYVGEWNRLISTTNWEKGRIICEWKTAMLAAGFSHREGSDEAWAQQVGHVSSQHVGRLRRTFERFGSRFRDFSGLFWSHFQATLDWPDADEWLTKASEGRLSVSQMRQARWEAQGSPADEEPRDETPAADFDEDVGTESYEPAPNQGVEWSSRGESMTDFGDDAPFDAAPSTDTSHLLTADDVPMIADTVARVRPFEQVPQLPPDLSDAFEQFKLAIVRHRLSQWRETNPDDVLFALDALKQLVLAPADES